MAKTAYAVVWIDNATGETIAGGIYSEDQPTNVGHNGIPAVLFKAEADDYETAQWDLVEYISGRFPLLWEKLFHKSVH